MFLAMSTTNFCSIDCMLVPSSQIPENSRQWRVLREKSGRQQAFQCWQRTEYSSQFFILHSNHEWSEGSLDNRLFLFFCLSFGSLFLPRFGHFCRGYAAEMDAEMGCWSRLQDSSQTVIYVSYPVMFSMSAYCERNCALNCWPSHKSVS